MKVWFEQHGDSSLPDIVLLHGWGMNSHIWESLLPELTQYFFVTVVDIPGLGQSVDVADPMDLEGITQRMAEVVTAPAIWIGWSLGGVIAASIAQTYPEKVTHLVTVASNPCFVQRDGWSLGMATTTYTEFKALIKAQGSKALTRFCLLQVQGDTYSKPILKRLKQILSGSEPTALLETLELLEEDHRSTLQEINVPTLHVLGKEDVLVPASLAVWLQSYCPAQRVCMVEHAGHLPFLSNSDQFMDELLDFAGAKASHE